jgi:hypothetical protein
MLEAVHSCEKKNSYNEVTLSGRGLPVVFIIAVIFAVVLVAICHRCRHRHRIACVLEFLVVHHPPPLPLHGSDELCELSNLLLPPHKVPAAAAPGGHVCNIIFCRTMVILASSASPAAASATASPMLWGHLPPQVAMTPAMMISSPLAYARPGRHHHCCHYCRLCVSQGLGSRPPHCRCESHSRPGGWARGKGQKSKVPGRICPCHRQPDAGSHGPGPTPVQGVARKTPAPCGRDGRAVNAGPPS